MKKQTAVIVVLLVMVTVIVVSFVMLVPGFAGTGSGGFLGLNSGSEYSVIANESDYVEYAIYDNGIMSAILPVGWVVDVSPADMFHYMFTAYNPNNTDFRITVILKSDSFIKTREMQEDYNRHYTSVMSEAPVMDPATVDRFYSILNDSLSATDLGDFSCPAITDFQITEAFGTTEGGSDVVRAVCVNENGRTVDGIFSAEIEETEAYGVTVVEICNAVFFTAPDGRLIEWEPILTFCVGTVCFSETFAELCGADNSQTPSVPTDGAAFAELTDLILSGWEARDPAYDIQNQKQNDSSLGFERIMDTETGKVYRADIGFSADEPVGKFIPIPDDLYLKPTSGYICRN